MNQNMHDGNLRGRGKREKKAQKGKLFMESQKTAVEKWKKTGKKQKDQGAIE